MASQPASMRAREAAAALVIDASLDSTANVTRRSSRAAARTSGERRSVQHRRLKRRASRIPTVQSLRTLRAVRAACALAAGALACLPADGLLERAASGGAAVHPSPQGAAPRRSLRLLVLDAPPATRLTYRPTTDERSGRHDAPRWRGPRRLTWSVPAPEARARARPRGPCHAPGSRSRAGSAP